MAKTLQEIFDGTLMHMREQRKIAYDRVESRCAYRTTDSKGKMLMCAVGCHIPYKAYDPRIEGAVIAQFFTISKTDLANQLKKDKRALALARALDAADIDCAPETLNLLATLQEAHDSLEIYNNKAFMPRFERPMKDIAHRYSLIYKSPKELRRV